MLRQRDSTTLTPYESVLRAFAFVERLTAEEHVIVRAALERAEVAQAAHVSGRDPLRKSRHTGEQRRQPHTG